MKKIIPALGLMAVVWAAAPASAASLVDFAGTYRVWYNSDHNYTRQSRGDWKDSDSYFVSRLNLTLTFTPTDEVKVVWRLRAPDLARWGNGGNRVEAMTKFVYGQITQPWGTVRVGRLDAPDHLGLASMGYLPASVDTGWTKLGPFDSSDDRDSVYFTNQWGNGFGLIAYYSKMRSPGYEYSVNGESAYYGDSDSDHDRFIVEPRYEWETGGASLGLRFDRNYSDPGSLNNTAAHDPRDVQTRKYNNGAYWSLNPALMQTWGRFSAHFEAKLAWGDMWRQAYDDAGALVNRRGAADPNRKYQEKGQAYYLNGDYNYGDGNLTLSGWWVDGNRIVADPAKRKDQNSHALVNMDDDFFPLVVAYAAENVGGGHNGRYIPNRDGGGNAISLANNAGLLLGDMPTGTFGGLGTPDLPANTLLTPARGNGQSNHWGLAFNGTHNFTGEVAISYALGYLRLDNPNFQVGGYYNTDAARFTRFTTQSKDIGWEADLGLRIKLLDNLTYTATFGYMFNGEAFKSFKGYRPVLNTATDEVDYKAEWRDPKDTYSWLNTLSFDF